MYAFTETVLFSNKELQREFYDGPYYPEWKICIGKRVVHILGQSSDRSPQKLR